MNGILDLFPTYEHSTLDLAPTYTCSTLELPLLKCVVVLTVGVTLVDQLDPVVPSLVPRSDIPLPPLQGLVPLSEHVM